MGLYPVQCTESRMVAPESWHIRPVGGSSAGLPARRNVRQRRPLDVKWALLPLGRRCLTSRSTHEKAFSRPVASFRVARRSFAADLRLAGAVEVIRCQKARYS